mgnify:CR=1 FL=1
MTIAKHEFQYIQPGKVAVLCDGQFGSTGKGLLAAYLSCQDHNEVDIATTNAAANAGHWTKFKDPNREDFCCFHLPTFGVIQPDCKIFLNAGSIINVDMLFQEIEECKININRLIIHPNASIISIDDINYEADEHSDATMIASTRKGVGRALSRKVNRSALLAKDDPRLKAYISTPNLNTCLQKGGRISMEIPQGYSLSLNGPFYPYCTSRNCTVGAGMNDAGIHASFLGQVAMAMRTLPIRVGNIPGGGHSGDVYPDQEELTWEQIGQIPELTTVTKRERRIFSWSDIQCLMAIVDNRPSVTFLNFCNYIDETQVDLIHDAIQLASMQNLGVRQRFLLGHGPNVEDVEPLPWTNMELDS